MFTFAPDYTHRRWLGALGHVSALKYAYTLPGGASTMSATLAVPPSYRTDALDPGRILRVVRGTDVVWDGKLVEPVPTAGGFQISGIGLGAAGNDFMGAYAVYNLNDPVNQAINRGLRWINPGIATGYLTTVPAAVPPVPPPDSASFSVTDFLNGITSKDQQTWYVDQHRVLRVYPLPTAVTHLLVCTDPVPRTITADLNTAWVKYVATDNGSGTTTTAAVAAVNQASVDKHGRMETYIDASNAGLNLGLAPGATALGTAVLAKYQRAAWSGPFTVQQGQLLTIGGVPVDLAAQDCGHMVCKLMVSDAPYGGEITAGPITFLVGGYEYDDDLQQASITPAATYITDIAKLLQNSVSWV